MGEAAATARFATGAAWVVGWRLSTRLLGFASTLAMVRLLAPADFGLVMLAATATAAVEAVSAVGIQDALLRERHADRPLYDTAFTMNALRCLAMAAVIAAAARPAATFFADPRLAPVLLVLSVVTALGAAENIRIVDFRRELAFHREFALLLLPRLAAIAVSLAIAARWHSYWALVAGLATNRLLQVALGYRLRPWRPRLSLRRWRRIIGFSAWTWLCSVVVLGRDRSDTVVIGHTLGSAPVGLFSVGAELAALPTSELVEPLCRVLFPKFIATGHAGDGLAAAFCRAVAVTSLLTFPAGVGIALLAAPLVALVFGPGWAAAVPVLAILALAGTVKVVALISATLFAATGLLRSSFRIIMVTGAVRLALLLGLVPALGLPGAAVAILVSVTLEEALFLATAARRLGFAPGKLWRQVWRALAATAAMAAILSAAGLGGSTAAAHPAAQLAAAVTLGIAAYGGSLAALWLLAGGPDGAEQYLLHELRRVLPAPR
jgi:O-antigen/teichoic acid export membrane protein